MVENPQTRTKPMSNENAGRILRLTRTFAAPRETVFQAWTDREILVKWWGPKGYTVPVAEIDVRPGGAWRTCMRSPEGEEYCVGGVYREVIPPEKLVFTWAWESDGEPGHETVVTIEFHDKDGATELVLVQELFESVEARDKHNQGWSSSFDCLAEAL